MILLLLFLQIDSVVNDTIYLHADKIYPLDTASYSTCSIDFSTDHFIWFPNHDEIHLRHGISCSYWNPPHYLFRKYFIIDYNDTLKIPNWVAYYTNRSCLAADNAKRTDDFRPDPELPIDRRAELSDYDGTPYDRGHNAPANDFRICQEAMSTTFLLSNMSPQSPELNRGPWLQLEKEIRRRIKQCGQGWIFTGNMFLDSTIFIGNHCAVPSHCYKVVLLDSAGQFKVFAALLPNSRTVGPWTEYKLSIDSLEKLTKYDFFCLLPDSVQSEIEK